MTINNRIEQAIFDRAGKGKKGEQAVMNYRDYLDYHNRFLKQAGKDFMRQRYMPKNENKQGTSNVYTRIDE